MNEAQRHNYIAIDKLELAAHLENVRIIGNERNNAINAINDCKTMASIIDVTYKQRLDRLMDYILDAPSNTEQAFIAGMMKAYNIVAGNR